ncbi:MAG: 3-oxoacyl-[acyl-carrier protein] reductase [Acidimicrobiaceae bacterium]|jgi:3-oxoacyl-[acyl-carrier protein] reductase|nr:3-oxoacyl-[acyl-carrier protein] reductase [Acidimicrobiaceae bacterium]
MDLGISGKVALVTASSKGLGLASAQALSAEGCPVVMCARSADVLSAAAATLAGESLAIPIDVTEEGAPAELVRRTVERFGGLDILVANAGGPPPGRSLDLTDEQLRAAVNANLLTSVRLVRESVPHMRAGGWGRVCLITSSSVKQPIRSLALSNTARTGLWAWAKTAAMDLFEDGITVNLACPGSHATDRMKELGATGPMGDPADFGRVVAFMCSQSAAFMTGTTVLVDGGSTVGLQ